MLQPPGPLRVGVSIARGHLTWRVESGSTPRRERYGPRAGKARLTFECELVPAHSLLRSVREWTVDCAGVRSGGSHRARRGCGPACSALQFEFASMQHISFLRIIPYGRPSFLTFSTQDGRNQNSFGHNNTALVAESSIIPAQSVPDVRTGRPVRSANVNWLETPCKIRTVAARKKRWSVHARWISATYRHAVPRWPRQSRRQRKMMMPSKMTAQQCSTQSSTEWTHRWWKPMHLLRSHRLRKQIWQQKDPLPLLQGRFALVASGQ